MRRDKNERPREAGGRVGGLVELVELVELVGLVGLGVDGGGWVGGREDGWERLGR